MNATLKDIDRLIITHGHIDHFGGANYVLDVSDAQVAIHGLDVSTIRNFEERRIVAAKDLQVFLERSGLTPTRVASMLEMNAWSKGLFKPVGVDIVLEEGPLPDSAFHVYHAPRPPATQPKSKSAATAAPPLQGPGDVFEPTDSRSAVHVYAQVAAIP